MVDISDQWGMAVISYTKYPFITLSGVNWSSIPGYVIVVNSLEWIKYAPNVILFFQQERFVIEDDCLAPLGCVVSRTLWWSHLMLNVLISNLHVYLHYVNHCMVSNDRLVASVMLVMALIVLCDCLLNPPSQNSPQSESQGTYFNDSSMSTFSFFVLSLLCQVMCR